jgi:hypothetical protein
MSKFLKFNIVNTTTHAAQGIELVNVEQIQSVAYNAGALTIVLDGAASTQAAHTGSGATDEAVPVLSLSQRVVTLTVVATKDGTGGAPTITNGAKSPQKAVYAAMTANPGGVQSTVQLGLDEAATPVQMYFSAFAIATAAIV